MKSLFKCSVEPKHETSFQGTRQNTNTPEGTFFPEHFPASPMLAISRGHNILPTQKRHIKALIRREIPQNFPYMCALFHCPPKWVMTTVYPILGLCSDKSPGMILKSRLSLGKPAPGCTSGNGWHIFLLKGWWPKRNFPG